MATRRIPFLIKKTFHLFCALASANALTISEKNTTVRCLAGSFQTGENATITCLFEHDISNNNQSIEVMWYPSGGKDDLKVSGVRVLVCPPSSTGLSCKVTAKGFTFDGHLSDTLTIIVPNFTRQYQGVYGCQMIPSRGTRREKCILRVLAESSSGCADQRERRQICSCNCNCTHQILGEGGALVIAVSVLVVAVTILVPSFVLNIYFIKCRIAKYERDDYTSEDTRRSGSRTYQAVEYSNQQTVSVTIPEENQPRQRRNRQNATDA